MAPRRHLRNRKRIKAPKRLEDEYDFTSPRRQESSHEEERKKNKEESSELEEEIYKPPKLTTPKKSKQPAYRGKVIEFNPNLPPAAFPTLDHPSHAHNGGSVPIDLELHFPLWRSKVLESQGLAGYESIKAINPDSLAHHRHSEESDRTEDDLPILIPIPTPTNCAHPENLRVKERSNMPPKHARGGELSSSMYEEPTDNGLSNPIWLRNIAWMKETSKMSNRDRIMLEMETSDEDEGDAAGAGRPAKRAKKKATGTPKFPAWDELTIAHKLDLADTIAKIHPDRAQVMHQLRLNSSQKESLVELLIQRQDRAARQIANHQRLMEQTQKMFLRGEQVSQSTFRQMVEENLYGEIHEDDHCQTNMMELKKARAYLQYCGFDPALADRSWEVPSISDAEPRSRSAQSESEANSSNASSQNPPGPSETPISPRPVLPTPSQESPRLPDHPSELLQQHQHNTEGTQPQHRPPPPAPHALNVQHSPAAPPSNVSCQSSYQVAAPDGNGGQSNNDLLAGYQDMKRATHQSNYNSLSASAVQSNYMTPFPRDRDTTSVPKKKKEAAREASPSTSPSPFLPLRPNNNNKPQQEEEPSSSPPIHTHVQIGSDAPVAPKSKSKSKSKGMMDEHKDNDDDDDNGSLTMMQQSSHLQHLHHHHHHHHQQQQGRDAKEVPTNTNNHYNAGVSSSLPSSAASATATATATAHDDNNDDDDGGGRTIVGNDSAAVNVHVDYNENEKDKNKNKKKRKKGGGC